jgi:hypothetical protein
MESMQPGTMQGRVGSASPIRPSRVSADIPEEEDIESEDATKSSTSNDLLPWTDYFRASGPGGRGFNLSHVPYREDHRTLHVYWNDIFQPDDSYLLLGNRIIFTDPALDLRAGDRITAKYWYLLGSGSGSPTPNGTGGFWDMECWFFSSDPGMRYAYITGGGAVTGQNGGSVSFLSMVHTDASFFSSVGLRFRKPAGTPDIPVDANLRWFITLDAIVKGARVSLSLPAGALVYDGGAIGNMEPDHPQGTASGTESGGGPSKLFCGLDLWEDTDPLPPENTSGFTSGTFRPSVSGGATEFVPPNGGSDNLAAWLNSGLSIDVNVSPGRGGQKIPCSLGGIYGSFAYYKSPTFGLDLGVTCMED